MDSVAASGFSNSSRCGIADTIFRQLAKTHRSNAVDSLLACALPQKPVTEIEVRVAVLSRYVFRSSLLSSGRVVTMANQKQALAVSDFCEALGHRMRKQRRSKRLSIEQLSALSGLVAADSRALRIWRRLPVCGRSSSASQTLFGISLDALLGRE
jgi:hypothetical protein